MKVDTQFSELLGAIYEGALEESPWHSFLSRLRECLNAANTTLVLRPPSREGRGVLLTDGGSLENIATYNERLFVLDPFIDLPIGEVHSLVEFMGLERYLQSELYKNSMAPSGLFDSLGSDLLVPGELEARLRVSRVAGARPFSVQDKALVAAIMPHLERAIRIHARLNKIESERALYAGAVEQLAVATFILDERGRLLNCNELARRLLEQQDGITKVDGRLQLHSRENNREMQQLIERVLADQKSGKLALIEAMRVRRPSGQLDFGLVIRPVPVQTWSEGKSVPSVAIFASDPAMESEAPTAIITRLFGFTRTEAALSMLLANGLTLDEAAEQLHISRNTVRTHLRSVFAKTGVNRQPMLVRLILKSVAVLA